MEPGWVSHSRTTGAEIRGQLTSPEEGGQVWSRKNLKMATTLQRSSDEK